MSSRHQKEKRLRPRHDPYKRDHFNQSQYLRIDPNKKPDNKDIIQEQENEEYEELYDEDDF
jgi:hypothetical protein